LADRNDIAFATLIRKRYTSAIREVTLAELSLFSYSHSLQVIFSGDNFNYKYFYIKPIKGEVGL